MEREESAAHSSRVGKRDDAGWGAYYQGTLPCSLKVFLKHVKDANVLLKSDNITCLHKSSWWHEFANFSENETLWLW